MKFIPCWKEDAIRDAFRDLLCRDLPNWIDSTPEVSGMRIGHLTLIILDCAGIDTNIGLIATPVYKFLPLGIVARALAIGRAILQEGPPLLNRYARQSWKMRYRSGRTGALLDQIVKIEVRPLESRAPAFRYANFIIRPEAS